MSRAIRRQQLRERAKAGRSPQPRVIPRTTTARPAQRPSSRGGLLSWRPRFLMDIITELRKVAWPTRDDVVYLTIVVVIVTIIIGAILGAIDIGFGWLIDQTILRG